jgi:segregation and condensation protein A
VVARFLGLLELYRDGAVAFDQAAALSELRVRWTAAPGPEHSTEADAQSDDDESQHEADAPGDRRDLDEEYE